MVGTLTKNDLIEIAKTKSFEDFEAENGIDILEESPNQERFGYPKSDYYKLLTKKKKAENKKLINRFLSEEI